MKRIVFIALFAFAFCMRGATAASPNFDPPTSHELASGLIHKMTDRKGTTVELLGNLWGNEAQDRETYKVFYDILRSLHDTGFFRDYQDPTVWQQSTSRKTRHCFISVSEYYEQSMSFIVTFECGKDDNRFGIGTDEYWRLRNTFLESFRKEYDLINRRSRR